jgi:hypothetical protein
MSAFLSSLRKMKDAYISFLRGLPGRRAKPRWLLIMALLLVAAFISFRKDDEIAELLCVIAITALIFALNDNPSMCVTDKAENALDKPSGCRNESEN